MNTLKQHSLLMVNNNNNNKYFEAYFKEVSLVKDNLELFKIYHQKSPSVLFLNCHEPKMNGLDTLKKIRQSDKKVVVAIFTDKVVTDELLEALPLHLIGCIVEPFQKNKVKELLHHVDEELTLLSLPTDIGNRCILGFKDGFSFCSVLNRLYNDEHKEVALTKNEKRFIKILINTSEFVPTQTIEYLIWENASMSQNCSSRLKSLLNGVRKKLPKGSIINQYGLGYKLAGG